MLLQALHVDTEMKNLNLQVMLLVQNGVCVWECRSHPTAGKSDANPQSTQPRA